MLHDWLLLMALVWLGGAIIVAILTSDSVWNGWRVAMVVLWPLYAALYVVTFVGLLLQGD